MDDLKTKLAAIRNLPEQVRSAVQGLDETQLDTPYHDGGWTPRQIVHHIADSHMNALIRMKLILAEDHPTLKTYEQDDWAKMSDSRMDIAPSLSIIDGVQARMAHLLENVKENEWVRSAHHPENGEMTLGQIAEMYSKHGKGHVDKIKAFRERMYW